MAKIDFRQTSSSPPKGLLCVASTAYDRNLRRTWMYLAISDLPLAANETGHEIVDAGNPCGSPGHRIVI
jgi:hypothetical protein